MLIEKESVHFTKCLSQQEQSLRISIFFTPWPSYNTFCLKLQICSENRQFD